MEVREGSETVVAWFRTLEARTAAEYREIRAGLLIMFGRRAPSGRQLLAILASLLALAFVAAALGPVWTLSYCFAVVGATGLLIVVMTRKMTARNQKYLQLNEHYVLLEKARSGEIPDTPAAIERQAARLEDELFAD